MTGSGNRRGSSRPPLEASGSAERLATLGSRRLLRRRAHRLAAAAVLLGGRLLRRPPRARRPRSAAGHVSTSVAVLPIKDLQGDTSRAYISEGLTDELSTDLAQIRGLQVINRQTMQILRQERKDSPADRGRARGGRGRDRHAAAAGRQRCTSRRRSPRAGAIARSGRGATAVAPATSSGSSVRPRGRWASGCGANTRAAPRRVRPAGDPEAIDAYIRGRYWWNRRGQSNLLRAIQFFGQALDADPSFAPAYAGMADAYTQLGYGSWLAPDGCVSQGGGRGAEGARARFHPGRASRRPGLLQHVLRLGLGGGRAGVPDSPSRGIPATPRRTSGMGCFSRRWGDSTRRWPRSGGPRPWTRSRTPSPGPQAGCCTTAAGRMTPSGCCAPRSGSTPPSAWATSIWAGCSRPRVSSTARSASTSRNCPGHWASGRRRCRGSGNLYAAEGRRADALRMLQQMDSLSRSRYITSFAVAVVHAGLNQPDSTFAWLDRAVKERTHWLVWLNRDPRWRALRGDPRFVDLVHRVGLPP